jgi:hypothetical protein
MLEGVAERLGRVGGAGAPEVTLGHPFEVLQGLGEGKSPLVPFHAPVAHHDLLPKVSLSQESGLRSLRSHS